MKKIWILNHYASVMLKQRGGRHYWMAKELLKKGYQPVIFCANVVHNAEEDVTVAEDFAEKQQDGITFVIVKTTPYTGNGISRIRNILSFYRNVRKVMKKYIKNGADKPDIILASSVHPFTCAAGIKMAKKWKKPCIAEIRDLWPRELVDIGALKEKSLAAKALYQFEKWIYKKADAVVFTMEGGKDYIRDKKWNRENNGPIDLDKIFYINNGVDIKAFEENAQKYPSNDPDINSDQYFNLVYTGSVRRTNQIDALLDTAKELSDEPQIRLLIWGAGDYAEQIEKRIQEENITNAAYKGVVEKKEVPGILVKSDVNVVHWNDMDTLRYGCSYNKMFEYLAAGKPIFSTVHPGYSIIKRGKCGMEATANTPKKFAEDIRSMYHMSKEQRERMGANARETAKEFDFSVLTDRLIEIIENL